jgi:hypothetical protein
LLFGGLYRLVPSVLDALKICQTGDSDSLAPRRLPSLLALEIEAAGGRPKIPREIRQLIRDMSVANPLWGAPRIHGELLKLGINLGQTTVAK